MYRQFDRVQSGTSSSRLHCTVMYSFDQTNRQVRIKTLESPEDLWEKEDHQDEQNRKISPETTRVIIQLIDFNLILLCSLLSFFIYFVSIYGSMDTWLECAFLGIIGGVSFVYINNLQGGYELNQLVSPRVQSRLLLIGCCLTPLIITLMVFLLKIGDQLSRGWLLVWWMLAGLLILPTRMFVVSSLNRLVHSGFIKPRAVVIGRSNLAHAFASWVDTQASCAPIEIGGVFDRRVVLDWFAELSEPPQLADLRACFNLDDIDVIFVAADTSPDAEMEKLLDSLSGIPVEIVAFAPPVVGRQVHEHHATFGFYGSYPAVRLRENRLKEWNSIVKRLIDVVIAATALVFLAPLLLGVALAIKLDSPGPVLFRQRRFGFFNQPIEMLKFRSMYVDEQDHRGAHRTVRDDPRVTRVGRFIRRSSIDELPQLINVLWGQMSIIGPRAHPIAMQVDGDYYYRAVRNYADRHRVKPGLTGWAQVNGSRGEIITH